MERDGEENKGRKQVRTELEKVGKIMREYQSKN